MDVGASDPASASAHISAVFEDSVQYRTLTAAENIGVGRPDRVHDRDALYRDRSALLISHRLSSVRFADRICVLDKGRITESGSHHELLSAGGTYAELFELQARAYR